MVSPVDTGITQCTNPIIIPMSMFLDLKTHPTWTLGRNI